MKAIFSYFFFKCVALGPLHTGKNKCLNCRFCSALFSGSHFELSWCYPMSCCRVHIHILCSVQGEKILGTKSPPQAGFFCRALGVFYAHTLPDLSICSKKLRMDDSEKRFEQSLLLPIIQSTSEISAATSQSVQSAAGTKHPHATGQLSAASSVLV